MGIKAKSTQLQAVSFTANYELCTQPINPIKNPKKPGDFNNMKLKSMLILGLLVVGTAVFFLVFSNQSQAGAVESAFFSTESDSELMCSLSESQQKMSADAFAEMMPTFQHPRCANCHGGVRPFAANTTHAGGKFDLVLDAHGDALIEKTFGGCQNCHGGLPGWEVPTIDLSFVGKDALTLCKQMKGEFSSAENFMDHLTRDRGKTPFIAAAFAGMRGLNQEGSDFYEALNDKKPVPEPPPASHAALISQGQSWVDAMGGEFKGGESCGCEPQQYAIRLDEVFTGNFIYDGGSIIWDGSAHVQIPITFKDDGSFTGETRADRTISATLAGLVDCSTSVTYSVRWVVEGRMNEEDQTITFSVQLFHDPAQMGCGAPAMESDNDNSNFGSPLSQVTMDAYVNEEKVVEQDTNINDVHLNDKFTIVIVKVN